MYKEKRSSRSEFVPIRGLRYHVRIWDGAGETDSALPPLVLVHGWMDVAASYQFMVTPSRTPSPKAAPSLRPTGAASG
jgi:pimeloyl-ACP methyl ester carboxylesterase